MKIATWNVNSIRVRLDRALAFLKRHEPDVVCLQEIKVVDEGFPEEAFREAGYQSTIFGQKTYNGVAILTRNPVQSVQRGIPGFEDPQSRVLAVTVDGVRVVNVYVPNGSQVGSEKFDYKLRWLEQLTQWIDEDGLLETPFLICGDFNIAPDDRDVYAPDEWRGRVLFHPDEHAALAKLQGLGLVDAFRLHQEEGDHYTWWDFRGGMFWKNKGLRIDHFLINEPLIPRCKSAEIDTWERKGKQPSDHAPVLITLEGGDSA